MCLPISWPFYKNTKMYKLAWARVIRLTSFLGDKYSSSSISASSIRIGSGLTLASLYSVMMTPLARALAGLGPGSISLGIVIGSLIALTKYGFKAKHNCMNWYLADHTNHFTYIYTLNYLPVTMKNIYCSSSVHVCNVTCYIQ